jgi:hypothetical protein
MTAPAFTPGPWRRVGHRAIAAGAGLDAVMVCEVFSGGPGIDQADGNEALIAAAPELAGVPLALDTALKAGVAIMPHRVMARMVAVLASVGRPAS